MADVFSKAVSANATKNGSVVTTVGVTANYVSDQSRAISGVSENTLENKYDNSFDDPTYYGGGGLSRGLLAYYRFEETSGVRYNRGTVGGGLNLTDNNTVGSATGAVAIQGNPAVGASFARSNSEYLSLSNPAELNVGGADFSISVWFKTSSAGSSQNILGMWEANKLSYLLFYNGVNQKIHWYTSANGTSSTSIASSTVSVDTFYNIVLVHDNSSGSEVYLNNSSIGTAGSVVKSQPSVAFVVSGIPTSLTPNYFNGVLDDLAIWNRQINSDEISQVYNSGSGKVLR